jgi:hypothetical protein
MASSRVPLSSAGSPTRRHRYNKALPPAYSHAIADESERLIRTQVAALHDAVAEGVDTCAAGRAMAALVRRRRALLCTRADSLQYAAMTLCRDRAVRRGCVHGVL